MPTRELYHGAQAHKMLFNIRSGAVTADALGKIFFAEYQWQNCFVHGVDSATGESYVGKFLVDIPDNAQVSREATSGNPDALILKLNPGGQVPAQLLELIVRRGVTGSFQIDRIVGAAAQAYLESKTRGR